MATVPQPSAHGQVRPAADFDIRPFLDGIAAAFAGGANVVLQLARPEVAYGVIESRWERGSLTKHPFKRGRTTSTFLAVAMVGTQRDIDIFREAVNDAHRLVRSTKASPVKYNAFDPKLQLWVAACLFYGPYDYYCRVYGEPEPEVAEAFYQHCSRFATSLQVPREMWPATLADFADYWQHQMDTLTIDPTVREFLMTILGAKFLPKPLPAIIGPSVRFVNIGFLPPEMREAMHLRWTDADERKLQRVLKGTRIVNRLTPGPIRRAGVYLALWDMRVRHKLGKPLT